VSNHLHRETGAMHLREEYQGPREILAMKAMDALEEAERLVRRRREVPLHEIDAIAQKYGLHTEGLLANLAARGLVVDWRKGTVRV